MAANPIYRMTVEEFIELPKPACDYDYELHYGELDR